MNYLICLLLISLRISFLSGNEIEEEASAAHKKQLIIDTDAGSDDAVAILNILGAEDLFQEVETMMITVVQGNTHVDHVGRNVLKILKTAQRLDIPVYKGANDSILTTPVTDNYFGKDGFGDFKFPNPPSEDLIQQEHAVFALIEAVSGFPGELTLLCLGPLTNIALAIRMFPKFLDNLKEIYILGGSVNGVGNIKPGVEFNVWEDPEAAMIVFKDAEKKKKILNVMPWETAVDAAIEMTWRKNVLGVIPSPQVDLLNKAEKMILKLDKWISSDAFLTSVVLDPKIVESTKDFNINVEVCGHFGRGGLFVDYASASNQTKNIRVIQKINKEKFKKMALTNLYPRGGNNSGASRSI